MKITITEKAQEKLETALHDKEGYLKLKYELDGPGCSVDGVFQLVIEHGLREGEVAVPAGRRQVYIDKAERVFFDDKMIIDYIPEKNRYKLHSPNQILNPRMKIVIK